MCSVLAALEWWEEAQQTSGSLRAAAGVRWWQLPKAATSSSSEAATWRAGRIASLSFISVQPRLMANVLRTCAGNGAGDAKPPQPPFDAAAAMERALQAAGVSWLEVCEWHSSQDWSVERTLVQGTARDAAQPASGGKGEPLRRLLRTLALASLATGTAMHDLALRAHATSDDEAHPSPDGVSNVAAAAAVKCVTVTVDVLSAVCMRVMHGLCVQPPGSDAEGGNAASGGLVDGCVMHALLVVVHHLLLWLTALGLASAHGFLSVTAELESPQYVARKTGLAAARQLMDAVEHICEALEGSLGKCRAMLGDGGSVSEAVSTCHRRCLAEVADEDMVLGELKSLGDAQQVALADAQASVKRMLGASRRVAAQLDP